MPRAGANGIKSAALLCCRCSRCHNLCTIQVFNLKNKLTSMPSPPRPIVWHAAHPVTCHVTTCSQCQHIIVGNHHQCAVVTHKPARCMGFLGGPDGAVPVSWLPPRPLHSAWAGGAVHPACAAGASGARRAVQFGCFFGA